MLKKFFRKSRGARVSAEAEEEGAGNETSTPAELTVPIDPVPQRQVLTQEDELRLYKEKCDQAKSSRHAYDRDGMELVDLPKTLGFLDQRWWPQTVPADARTRGDAKAVQPDANTLDYERSLSVLESMKHADVIQLYKKLKLKHSCPVEHPYLTDLTNDAESRLIEAFDQYTGLRMIGDLRGLPTNGAELHQEGTSAVTAVHDAMYGTLTWMFSIIHDDILRHKGTQTILNDVTEKLPILFDDMMVEYKDMLDHVLAKLNVLSSKRVKHPKSPQHTYNEYYTELLIEDVIKVTARYEKKVRVAVVDQLDKIERQCPLQLRTELISGVGGRKPFLAEVDVQLTGLRPWAVNWLKVQKDSFALREVFGSTEDDIAQRLEQSRQQAVSGFDSCLDSWVIEPLIDIGEKLDYLKKGYQSYVNQ